MYVLAVLTVRSPLLFGATRVLRRLSSQSNLVVRRVFRQTDKHLTVLHRYNRCLCVLSSCTHAHKNASYQATGTSCIHIDTSWRKKVASRVSTRMLLFAVHTAAEDTSYV